MSARIEEVPDWDDHRARLSPPPSNPAASCPFVGLVGLVGLGALYLVGRMAAWGVSELWAVMT